MRESHSFTEYVKNNLDNKLWTALENHIENADVKDLELRTRLRVIGKVELEDREYKSVKAKPYNGTEIKISIIWDATLDVWDDDIYHSDATDVAYQWFQFSCHGDLARNLQDFSIESIEVYSSNRKSEELSDDLVPIIRTADLETYADKFLAKFCPDAKTSPMAIDPFELASTLGLTVIKHCISKDHDIFGQIFFKDTDTQVYDEPSATYQTIHVKRGTILADPEIVFYRNLGSYNNTIIHECVHWVLHQNAFLLENLFNTEASQIRCQVTGGIANVQNDGTMWMEWQANALTPRIQMPYAMFRREANRLFRQYLEAYHTREKGEVVGLVIMELARVFNVSDVSAKFRLSEVGYDISRSALIYLDGHYVLPFGFADGSLHEDETFTIPTVDAVIQKATDPRLRSSDSYTFIENHFIRKDPKYLSVDAEGNIKLTEYGRFHLDECALKFEIHPKKKVSSYYHTECFLNRAQYALPECGYFLSKSYQQLDDASKKAEMDKYQTEIEAMRKELLSGDLASAWEGLLEWRGVKQSSLAAETMISKDTINNIVLGKTKPQLYNLVLICAALHLPYRLSKTIISDLYGINLEGGLNDTKLMTYRFVLDEQAGAPMNEIMRTLNLNT